MRLVVDTNILFSFFKDKSSARELIISNRSLELISPEVTLDQLGKYSALISSKSGLSKKEFGEVFLKLVLHVDFIPADKYKDKLKKAEALAKGWPEEEFKEFMDDIDFIALALKEGCSVWSNDKLLKKQSSVKVFGTGELIRLLSALIGP